MPGIIALLCLPCLLSLAAARPVEKLNAPTDILGTIPDSKSKLYLHTDGEIQQLRIITIIFDKRFHFQTYYTYNIIINIKTIFNF